MQQASLIGRRIPRCARARACATVLCALLLSTPGAGAADETDVNPDAEQLLFAQPPGWHEVYADREDKLSTTEYVPEGQSADYWEEMLTIQIMLDTPDADPDLMLTRAVAYLAESCHRFDAQPIQLGGAGNYPTLAVMTLCGRDAQTGEGDVSLLRAIAGHENFYLLQKSWRVAPYDVRRETPIDLEIRKFWLGYLAYLRVCDPKQESCMLGPEAEAPAE